MRDKTLFCVELMFLLGGRMRATLLHAESLVEIQARSSTTDRGSFMFIHHYQVEQFLV